jgi:copper chaperone CopZ
LTHIPLVGIFAIVRYPAGVSKVRRNAMSIVEIEYQVTGMTCGHCEMSVREEVEQVPGVTAIDVSATTGRLVVTADQPLDDAAVVAAVDEAGYQAVRVP